jgi:hypothetical protein
MTDGDLIFGDELSSVYNHSSHSSLVTAVGAHLNAMISADKVSASWHPLGFFRVEVARDSLGRRYVVHCWPAEERRTQNPAWLIHRHAWPLESVVLHGRLRDLEFEDAVPEVSDVAGALYVAFSGGPDLSVLSKHSDDTIDLAGASERTWYGGESYSVPLYRFHLTTVQKGESCVTLARIGEKKVQQAQVVGDVRGPRELTYRHERVAPDLLLRYAQILR